MIFLLISVNLKSILVLQVISDSFAEENIFARMRKSFVLLLIVLCCLDGFSQDSSATTIIDTTIQAPVVKRPASRPKVIHKDSIKVADSTVLIDSVALQDSVLSFVKIFRPGISLFRPQKDTTTLLLSPFFRFTDPVRYSITVKKWQGKEAFFYSMLALLIFFALIRTAFGRYLEDLFKTYFRTTVNQKQTKEQLLQNPLASLFLNLFFVMSIGMFAALLLQYYKLGLEFNFWWLYLYCVLALISIYAIKFMSLKLMGWIFQVSESTDAYIFIVFTTNKIIGIVLLPFLVILSFTNGLSNEAATSLGIILIIGLIVYRFFLSFISIRKQIHVGFFHFLLYLLAFEIVPLLLINKLLFSFLGETS
jgi:hypothetical protein